MGRSNLPAFLSVLPASVLRLDDGLGGRFAIFPTFTTRFFLLQLFVNFGKVFYFFKQMGRNIRQALGVIPERIGNGKAENLLIRSMLIPHLERTYGFRLNNTAGERWLPN